MEKKLGLDELVVYRVAMEIGEHVWEAVQKLEKFEKWSLGNQFCRAADSIAANIAEGFGRFHYNENKNFCFYARGSLMESKTWLNKAKSRNLVSDEEYLKLMDLHIRCHQLLNQYIKSIGKSSYGQVREFDNSYSANPDLEDFE